MTISLVRSAHAGGTATSATTLTIAFDCTSCDFIEVGIRDGAASAVTGVTVGGVASTFQRHDGTAGSPSVGTTLYGAINALSGMQNIVISFSSSVNLGAIVKGWAGVHQTTPVSRVGGQSTLAGASPYASTITCAADELASDFYVLRAASKTIAPSAQGAATALEPFTSDDGFVFHRSSYLAAATALGWTWDGPAPDTESQSYIVLKAAGASAASGVTLYGPTTGTAGSPSTNFTVGVTPIGGAITGTVVVTPAATGCTFSPATVSLTAASPTGTFTCTAAAAGAKTVGVTNNGALTNPASITYTASSNAATAVAVSGPATGAVGAASSNFTASANGVIAGTVIVTPSDGGAGGTFSPATVSISASTPTATFTYSAISAGAKTLSFANNGGLTNQANLTYTASATGSVSPYFLSVRATSNNYKDRVRDTATVVGTGTITLASVAQLGYRLLSTYAVGTKQIPLCVEDPATGEWETFLGTLATSGTVTRDTVLESSNGNALVPFAAGAKNIFVTLPAQSLKRLAVKSYIDLRDYPVDPTFTTDSTVGIQAAINDAFISGVQTIRVPEGRYKIAGALIGTDPFGRGCNGQLYIPASDHSTAMRSIKIIGEGQTNWGYGAINDEPITTGGVIFESTLTAGAGTLPAVIYGSTGYDGGFGLFSFTDFALENVCVRTNTSAGANKMGGLNLFNLANGGMLNNVKVEVNRGLRTNPDPTTVASVGIVTGQTNNSGMFKWGNVFVGGFFTAVRFSEHMCIERLTVYGCVNAVDLLDTNHASSIGMLNVEGCKNGIITNGGHAISIGTYDAEHNGPGTYYDFAADIKLNGAGTRKIAILLSAVVAGGVGVSDAGWSTNATSANYKVVAGAGAN